MTNLPIHYFANRRDLEFNLFEVLEVGRTALGRGPFTGLDEEAVRDTLRNFETFARDELAVDFYASDRRPPVRDAEGNVLLPDGLKRAMQAYFDGEWHLLDLPAHLGGFAAPPSVAWARFEMLAGAHPALTFYLFGNFVARVIDHLGTDEQKRRFLPRITERRWGGAMVLTEPDAGSDVGAARAKARHLHDDVWAIEGVKRFITNGDFDGTENIIHLVLARPEGAKLGTKGLSMFIVPKLWVEESGELGERNGMRCSNLEKKMGIKASATCEMTYGDGALCRGLLVGNVHDGIRQMFALIEQARMAVGVKSMSTLSTAYLNALAYTKERIQGPDLTKATVKDSPRVRIIAHPDVRRMLMAQKAHAEGMRALCLYTASIQDQVAILGGHESREAAELDSLNDLLLPLVKGYCSEKGYDLLRVSLQCYGGSGFLQDYPIEQYIRDQKIDSLYEGTTHIQALDLILRKVGRDGGATLRALIGRIVRSVVDGEGGEALQEERALLGGAARDLEAIFGTLLAKLGESLYHVGLQGNRVLFALAELVIGWLLFRQAAVALRRLPEAQGDDRPFYEGKVAAARWFLREVLPELKQVRAHVEASRLDLMTLAEEAF